MFNSNRISYVHDLAVEMMHQAYGDLWIYSGSIKYTHIIASQKAVAAWCITSVPEKWFNHRTTSRDEEGVLLCDREVEGRYMERYDSRRSELSGSTWSWKHPARGEKPCEGRASVWGEINQDEIMHVTFHASHDVFSWRHMSYLPDRYKGNGDQRKQRS